MKKTIALLIPILALSGGAASADEDAKEHKKRCGAEAPRCIREMADNLKKKGWIGIEWKEHDGRPHISHVVQGSPANAAGVQLGDIVMAFNGLSTDEDDEALWGEMKKSLVPGGVVTMAVLRDGAKKSLEVKLIAVPDHIVAQWVGVHVLEHHAALPDEGVDESP